MCRLEGAYVAVRFIMSVDLCFLLSKQVMPQVVGDKVTDMFDQRTTRPQLPMRLAWQG
jgi:hypothetical protein